MLSNPPFGVEWKKVEKIVRAEHERRGHYGRFGPGLPRVSDGSLLFLMHLLSKMRPAQQGGAQGQGAVHRRIGLLAQDAQIAWLQAQGTGR